MSATNPVGVLSIGGVEVEYRQAETVRAVDAVVDGGIAKPASVPLSKISGKWDSLPTVADALAGLEARIRDEQLKDFPGDIRALRMDPTGHIHAEGKRPIPFTHGALQQAVSILGAPRGSTGVMEWLSPDVRAHVFNEIAQRTDHTEPAVIRTMLSKGERIARAVTSQKHSLGRGDDLAIAAALRSAVPSNALMRITRGWDRSDFEIILPTKAAEVRKGDPVMARLRISNSETKHGALDVYGGLFRLVCLNGMVRAENDSESSTSMRHVGDLRSKIRNAVRVAILGIDEFAQRFGEAYEHAFPEGIRTEADALDRVGKIFPELGEDFLKAAGRVWHADGERDAGLTLAGLANALTRGAQDFPMHKAALAEEAAGELIMGGWARVRA